MLDPRTWLEQAKATPEGKSSRHQHDCGPGVCLIVNNKEGGWSAWCHRCAESGWVPKPLPSLAERAARQAARQAAERTIQADPRPPMPADFDVQGWPLLARVWLYKAGLFNQDIEQLGAYFHRPSGRVVIPVTMDGKVVYWQARNVGLCPEDAPKYLNPRVDKSRLVSVHGGGSEAVVLTEDVLSAFRVGQVGEGWALLGTALSASVLSKLIEDGRPVLVWLDNDAGVRNAGQRAAAKIIRLLQNTGVPCSNIITDKDAKAMSRAQIKEVIDAQLHYIQGR